MGTNDSYSAHVYIFHQKAKMFFLREIILQKKKSINYKLLLLQCIMLVLKPKSEMNKKLVI